MVETAAGAENIEAICATPGLDGIFIGPTDLAASLNVAVDAPEVDAAIERITNAAVTAGVPVGTNVAPEEVGRLVQEGMSLFVCFADYDGLAASAAAAMDLARGDG
jgi:4-hydroxy-2-oxoheptanedioate aldolase